MVSLLADHYKLDDGFFEILSGFRDRSLPTEEGFAGPLRSVLTENQCEFGWVYKYSESKKVDSGNPWCIRHTGLYHVFDIKHRKNTVFILSPSPTARFITHLKRAIQHAQVRSAILANPFTIHSMLISCHLSTWRGYLEYHETELLKLDLMSACSSIEQPRVTFDTLKEVRAIEKRILPLDPLLTNFNETTDHLQNIASVFIVSKGPYDNRLNKSRKILQDLRKEAGSYRLQVLYLQKRAQSTAQSILDSLNLGFQQLAQTQNNNTLLMARSAREDSVAIRAITLVTSLYLPFSFVASIFGMNLVDFDSDSHNIVVSKQFWLYFVISVPLTAATLVCWQCWMHAYRHSHLTEDRSKLNVFQRTKGSEEFEVV
ncbi:hypothetical protein B5807_06931 [Epicoccum nigrum]|uniref:Uncharacterized protein n=1 Tax=Epicoccum nigrum TaxID=105696 RepID=A0A1Y2LXR3_EPING|nr:hypothetical protein B5807_06931 [Epicoccum nigrum]